jgi:hypothetical protein
VRGIKDIKSQRVKPWRQVRSDVNSSHRARQSTKMCASRPRIRRDRPILLRWIA